MGWGRGMKFPAQIKKIYDVDDLAVVRLALVTYVEKSDKCSHTQRTSVLC